MARNRMISKEAAEDLKIGKLSDSAKWLFIQLWILADDEGFLQNQPDWIRIKVWPYEPEKTVDNFLKEIFDLKMLEEKNGIIKIKNFLKYQRIDKPQKSKLKAVFYNHSENGREESANGREESSRKEVKEKLKEVKEKEKKRKENGESPEPPLDNPEKPNDTANGTDSNCEDSAEIKNNPEEVKQPTDEPIPEGFKPLSDYLVRQGYDRPKAELVANLVQSVSGFVLGPDHVDIFKTNTEDEIKLTFDVLTHGLAAAKGKKITTGKEAGFATFGKKT